MMTATAAIMASIPFDELGVKGVVLLDRFQRLQVSYSGGSLVELTPNPAEPASVGEERD